MEIGIWGDSITYGQCDLAGLGWVGRLRVSLLESNIRIYNFGVCGDTTNELLKRFSVEADSIGPDIILFAIGINDSKFSRGETESKVPLKVFKENIGELLDLAKEYTTKIYIISATKTDDAFARSSGTRFLNETIEIYNTSLREIAVIHNIPFIDVFNLLNPETDLVDGLHPNAQGYEKMFNTITTIVTLS